MTANPAKLSSRAQVALYLHQKVGEGNRFTFNTLREAMPGINQLDRRMRELREVRWVIRTYKDHPTLAPQEYLLEKIGDAIWEPGYKMPASSARVSDAVRRDVFARDKNRCVVCGIAAGEEYMDRPGQARLTIGHLVPKGRKGWNDADNLRTECARCNETARHLTEAPVDLELLKAKVMDMPRKDRTELARWVMTGKRTYTKAEELWVQYRQLPAPQRNEIKEVLAEYLGDPA